MANGKHLLVPIKVQALVIDDLAIRRSIALQDGKKYFAGDGKWSPLAQDYRLLVNSLSAPGPKPFYGASRTFKGQPAEQLVLPATSSALPKMEKHRGVYLHWVLPSGLRHAYKPGSLDFPALPDQWLIVRFCRRGAEPQQTKAWFVDSSLVAGSDDTTNLIFAGSNKYETRQVGKVVELDQFVPADPQAKRTTITATGNSLTGSPTFTAFVAENRNIISWHDNLEDLRKQGLLKETALSYLLLGWYRDEQNEPLKVIPIHLKDKNPLEPLDAPAVLKAMGWTLDSTVPVPDDLLKYRSIFHGMVAHINYWNSDTYKGQMLGYPGSPSVEGVSRSTPPSFKVGIGNNAEDALVSLVSSEYSGKQGAPNLWKALEAVVYHQPETLVGSWNTAPRDHTVHQGWFSQLEAGKVWAIQPSPKNEGMFPSDPDKVAEETAVKPTSEQLADLKQLNELQSAADAIGREITALQQDLYARWWKLCDKSRDKSVQLDMDETACRTLIGRISTLRSQLDELLSRLGPLPEALKAKLPKELELRFDSAPRFWTPADPVIVVKNCGLPTKHQFPHSLPCRLPEQIIVAAKVVVEKTPHPFDTADGVTEITAAVQKHFVPQSESLTSLLKEGSLVEQAISDLATRTLPTDKKFFSAVQWQTWTARLVNDLTWDDKSDSRPLDEIQFVKSDTLNVSPHRLAELWVKQPWSPLFLDWQITWFPTPNSGQGFGPAWQLNEHDYQVSDKQPVPTKGVTVRGRSLLTPVDGSLFEKPIETLRELLEGKPTKDSISTFPKAVAEILRRYKSSWDTALEELKSAGLMGQALTGFHQALMRRDVTLPRIMPDSARPWVAREELKSLEAEVKTMLDMPDKEALTSERLAPPIYTDSKMPFTMIREGAFQLDELWLIDDFGQWADLLRGTSTGGALSPVFHPRVRWHEDRFAVAMPPRITQPVRLNFRFTAADNRLVESDSDPALSPICGWIFYNPLDQALVLCDKDGQLVGELVITERQKQFRINWQAGASNIALDDVRNPSLKAFAKALVETTPTQNPKLHALLNLIDHALERIRPAAARRDMALFGRPLALVSAGLGLELFGKAWTNLDDPPAATRPEGTGDKTLDALRLRVNLGCSHNTEDGLIGFFKAGVYDRIVPAQLPKKIESSDYVASPENNFIEVGFGAPESITMLIDPWGSVQAAVGIVPAKTITLAHANLDKTLAQMEASFRVGPVLLQADRLAMPTPVSDKGSWNFCGPLTNNAAAVIVPSDPKYFSDKPVVATEGRLLLLTTEE
jgi:hypothetical protein